jgi:hypothetical protein
MPLGPKLVLALQSLSLALNVLAGFSRPSTRAAIIIVIQSVIVGGLYRRQTAAWLAARWMSAIGVALALFLLVFLLIIPFSGSRHQFRAFWIYLALETTFVAVVLFLLGRADSRAYFNAPRKP